MSDTTSSLSDSRVRGRQVLLIVVAMCCEYLARSPLANAETLYVVNSNSGLTKQFALNGTESTFSTVAINSPTQAALAPGGLAVDSAGNIYVARISANEIDKISPDGVSTVFANTGLNGPTALLFDKAGNLYVSNQHGNYIEKVSPQGIGSLFIGPGPAPWGMAIDSEGNCYVSNWAANEIEKFSSAGVDLGLFASAGLDRPTFMLMSVPEPSSLVLLGSGFALGLFAINQRLSRKR